jgi:hypothetical protein
MIFIITNKNYYHSSYKVNYILIMFLLQFNLINFIKNYKLKNLAILDCCSLVWIFLVLNKNTYLKFISFKVLINHRLILS